MKIEIAKLIERAETVVLPGIKDSLTKLEEADKAYNWKLEALKLNVQLASAIKGNNVDRASEIAYELYRLRSGHERDVQRKLSDLQGQYERIVKFIAAVRIAKGDTINYNMNGAYGTESYIIRVILEYVPEQED